MPLNSLYIWYLHGVEYLLKLLGAIIPRRRFVTLTFTAHVSPQLHNFEVTAEPMRMTSDLSKINFLFL